MQAAAPRSGRPSLRRCGSGIKESRRDHCASLGSRSREDMCNDISPARADFRRVHDEGTTPAGSPMPWLETDFRQRYNHAVPTDRVSAEVPLSGEPIRQEALLDKLFATVPEAIVVLDTDDSILRVNPEFTRIFGYSEEEALGRPINQLVVPDEHWAEAEEYSRRGTRGEILNVETMRKRKDGTRVPVSIIGVPVSMAGSQISQYVIYRDITEPKRAEQRLRQSEAYLAEAQRLSQTGSWAWNASTGENTYGSEECLRVLGFDPAGAIPRFEEFFRRIHPDDQAKSRERFEKA